MKTLNMSMPVLEIPFGEEDLDTQNNNAKSEEVERKNYRMESPRKKMKFLARLKLDNFNSDINTNDQEVKQKKNSHKKKQKLVKEISKSDPTESYQLKIGLEIQQNGLKINQYHFKELDLGGYTLLVAPKIEREEAEEYYNKKNLKKLLKAEHKFVCQKVPFLTPTLSFYQKQERYPTACSYTNYSKNRYQDVLCNEESKFVFISESNDYLHQSMELEHSLESLLFDMHKTRTTVEEENKYINANYVRGSHCSNSVFIATQAPMEKTFPEFFEMIWQSKSKVVISLTPLVENQRAKMTPFWPLSKKPFLVSHFSIILAEETTHNNDIVVRKLEIKNINNGVTRNIYQIHFIGWLDNDVPSDPLSLIHIYSFQRKFEAEGSLEGLDGPSIVHCSAGIGRTSTYISFVFGAQIACHLKRSSPFVSRSDLNLSLDVPSIVINVRKQRCGSVQTWKQYGLIYKAINFYIKHEFERNI